MRSYHVQQKQRDEIRKDTQQSLLGVVPHLGFFKTTLKALLVMQGGEKTRRWRIASERMRTFNSAVANMQSTASTALHYRLNKKVHKALRVIALLCLHVYI